MLSIKQILGRSAIGIAFGLLPMGTALAQEQSISGIVVAENLAEISLHRSGLISEVYVELGQNVVVDDPIIALDCTSERSQLKVAQVEYEIATSEYRIQKKRAANGSGGRASVQRAQGQLELAQSEIDRVQSDVELCVVYAPFDGVVSQISVRAHEIVVAGEPQITILDPDNLRLELILPAEWLADISIGTKFKFTSSTDNKAYDAHITVISPRIDPVSQTVLTYAEFTNTRKMPRAGAAGLAEFNNN